MAALGDEDRCPIGLVRSGIGTSLSPALHEREADEQGLRCPYRTLDLTVLGRPPSVVGDIVAAAALTGYDGLNISTTNGIWPAFYGEMFRAEVRLSGMAIGTQIGFAVAGFAPTIAAAIAGAGTSGWISVAVFTAALRGVNVAAVATALETYRVPTETSASGPPEPRTPTSPSPERPRASPPGTPPSATGQPLLLTRTTLHTPSVPQRREEFTYMTHRPSCRHGEVCLLNVVSAHM